jgi:hypothetical protein
MPVFRVPAFQVARDDCAGSLRPWAIYSDDVSLITGGKKQEISADMMLWFWIF